MKIILLILLFWCSSAFSQAGVSPVINSVTPNVVTNVGLTATFGVSATGTSPLTYQWYSSVGNAAFTIMAGQTNSSRTTGALVLANSGNRYYCIVKNAFGSATSNVVTLTVNPIPIESPATTEIFFQTSTNANWQETDCNTICLNQVSTCPNTCENLKDDIDDFYNDTNSQYQGNQITQLGFN